MIFTLRAAPDQRVDLSGLTPDGLAGLDRGAIERLAIGTTRAKLVVGDLFGITDGSADEIVIEGGSARFDGVGTGMTRGAVRVNGTVGARAGRGLRGGALSVSGDAGPFAASGMRGGRIEIAGDAGSFLAAPLPGERAGMAGGLVVVRGNAGARAADRMRRGVILVEGSAGACAGSRMIAGTLIACGGAGADAGILMRRGTLVFGNALSPLPTFREAGAPAPVFPRLFARRLESESARAAALLRGIGRRLVGDMAALGKGEILLPA